MLRKLAGLAAAAVLCGTMAGGADAVTVIVNVDAGGNVTFSDGGPNTAYAAANVDLASTGALTLNSNSQVINPAVSISGQHKTPSDPVFSNNYLAVHINGEAALDFGTSGKALTGFTWGTVDTYNTLSIFDVATTTGYTITGTALLNYLNLSSGIEAIDILFNSANGPITKAIFNNGNQNAFEIGNVAATPLPPALFLFGFALAGLTWLSRRRHSAGAA